MKVRLLFIMVLPTTYYYCRAFFIGRLRSSSPSISSINSALLLVQRHYVSNNNNKSTPDEEDKTTTKTKSTTPPEIGTWNHPRVDDTIKKKRRKNNTRFRQHVNPLARQYQQPTILSEQWPYDVYDDCTKPLHLDIGCAKGQFLIDMAKSSTSSSSSSSNNAAAQEEYNYLGLEVRPLVAQFAKERIAIHNLTGKLDFIGCNVNVDLDRILSRYQQAASASASSSSSTTTSSDDDDDDDDDNDRNQHQKLLHRVSIQYPDPHFKTHHAKRRVVNEQLVHVLAKYLIPSNDRRGQVFLQSDVQSVCDDMRRRFRTYGEHYFHDELDGNDSEYLSENIWGVPTEREVSVLKKGLPVYRALFTRTSQPYDHDPVTDTTTNTTTTNG